MLTMPLCGKHVVWSTVGLAGSRLVCPFFPTIEGLTVTKNAIVALVVQAALQHCLRVVAEYGRGAWTGHVFRITGAQHLARKGVELALIMLLARWASAVILAYLKEAVI